MKTLPISIARKDIANLVEKVAETSEAFVIGRHNKPEAVLIKFPSAFTPSLGDITNINAYSASFDFLNNEPDLYSKSDVKKK